MTHVVANWWPTSPHCTTLQYNRQHEVAVYMYFTLITFYHILYVLFYINLYMGLFLLNTVIYVFLLLCLCILIVYLCIFIVPAGTLRLSWLRFFRAFSSVVRQNARVKPANMGHSSKLFVSFCVLFVLYRSVYCSCANVFCTSVTGWLHNCS